MNMATDKTLAMHGELDNNERISIIEVNINN